MNGTSRVPSTWAVLVAVGCGGAAGAGSRYALTALPATAPDWIPLATLVANVLGTIVLGMLMSAPVGLLPWERLSRPALGAGLCGGLTTFSTLALEVTDGLAVNAGGAAGYAALSLILAPVSALAGVMLMRAITSGTQRGGASR